MNTRPSLVELPTRALPAATQELANECARVWATLGLAKKPRIRWFPRAILPHANILSSLFEEANDGDLDAVVLIDERRRSPYHDLRDVIDQPAVPIIDIFGRAGNYTDVRFDLHDRSTWEPTARSILAFRDRRRRLTKKAIDANDVETKLLGHAFVSGRDMIASRYPGVEETIAYPGHVSARQLVPVAERLAYRGLLRRTYFDRAHECRKCSSRRLVAREECPTCGSSDLQNKALIHHFHCAALFPEDRFKQGSSLVCPKCRQTLRNYGKDYDKPGGAMCCGQCNGVTSEPNIGFACLDCDTRTDGDEAKTVDIYSYALTEQAINLLTDGARRDVDRLPSEVTERLGPSHAVIEIEYAAREKIVAASGEVTFGKLRRLFLENVTNQLGPAETLHSSGPADYLVVAEDNSGLHDRLATLLARGEATLSEGLEPTIRVAVRGTQGSK